MKKIENEYALIGAETKNIRLMAHEIMLIHRMLDENDQLAEFL